MGAAVGCDPGSNHAQSRNASEDHHSPATESISDALSTATEMDSVTVELTEGFCATDYVFEVEIANILSVPIFYWPEHWHVSRQNGGEWEPVEPTGIHRDLISEPIRWLPGASHRIVYGLLPYAPNMKAGLYRISDGYSMKDPKKVLRAGGLPKSTSIRIPTFIYRGFGSTCENTSNCRCARAR